MPEHKRGLSRPASEIARDLAEAVPGIATSASDVDRAHYARDLWPRHHLAIRSGHGAPVPPAAIAWPRSTEDVAAIARWASDRGTPLVPFGAGSGVCAGVLPTPDALIVDLKRMSAVRSLDPRTKRLVVEAGALGLPLEQSLERQGITLGHFPSSILCSTVGGWVATRSAGQASGYYGKIEDMVVDLECVTASGEVVSLPRRRVGPDLSALLVGSEGALGIVTAATLRVHNTPIDRAFAAFSFRDVESGLEAMRCLYQAGLRPAVCRLYDPFDASLARSGKVKRRARGLHASPWWREAALRAVIARSGLLNAIVHGALGERALGGALLVLIFESPQKGEAAADRARATSLLTPLAARDEGEGPAKRWLEHRYSVSFRQSPAIRSGLFIDTFEVAAPWSRLEGVYDAVRRALGAHAFVMAHFSHAYPDGCCIYFSFAGTARPLTSSGAFEVASTERYDAAWRDAMAAAVDAGATVAHHHGVGRSKARGMAREIPGGIETMLALKRAFDPQKILNPGVLIPDESAPPLAAAHGAAGTISKDAWLDDTSLLAHAKGDRPLAELVRSLGERGFRLRGEVEGAARMSVGEWLGAGAPGSPDAFGDPVDHVVAGITVRMPRGRVTVPPVPRRATGPDFGALAVGAEGAFGASVESAWLRIERADRVPRPAAPFEWHDAQPLSDAERQLVAKVAAEL